MSFHPSRAHGANLAFDVRQTFAHDNGIDVTTEVIASLKAALGDLCLKSQSCKWSLQLMRCDRQKLVTLSYRFLSAPDHQCVVDGHACSPSKLFSDFKIE